MGNEILGPEDIVMKIMEGRRDFKSVVITSDLHLRSSDFMPAHHFNLGNMLFAEAVVQGDLIIEREIVVGAIHHINAIIKGNVVYCGVTFVKGIVSFRGATIEKDLDLSETEIKGGILDLAGTKIGGSLDLSTKAGPKKIYTDKENAQLVHLAAPTVPLVILKG